MTRYLSLALLGVGITGVAMWQAGPPLAILSFLCVPLGLAGAATFLLELATRDYRQIVLKSIALLAFLAACWRFWPPVD